nr:MAG TPA: hypothetical protein [Ackermannviridae sp.]
MPYIRLELIPFLCPIRLYLLSYLNIRFKVGLEPTSLTARRTIYH